MTDDDGSKQPARGARSPLILTVLLGRVSLSYTTIPHYEWELNLQRSTLGYGCHDATANLLEAVMGLEGKLGIDERNKYPNSYATTGVTSDGVNGIFFHQNLAKRPKQSTLHYDKNANASCDQMSKDTELVGLDAAVQQPWSMRSAIWNTI